MQQMCNTFSLDFLAGADREACRRGLPTAFGAGAALWAGFSLPPLLRDFGEDEFVREDARGGAGVRNREGIGGGGEAWRVFRANGRDR